MNEMTPQENSRDAFADNARVLAFCENALPDGAAPRAEDAPSFRTAGDDNFRAASQSPFSASGENSTPHFSASTPDDFSPPNAAPFFAPQNAAAPTAINPGDATADSQGVAAQIADHENAASQNAELSRNAAPHTDFAAPPRADFTAPQIAPSPDAPLQQTPGAPPQPSPAEDAASTRRARGGVAALVGNVSPRILTALIGIPLVLLVVWQGGALLTGITVLLALTAMRELIVAARKNKTPLVIEWCYFLLLFAMIALWNTMPLWREAAGYSDGMIIEFQVRPALLHLAWPLLTLIFVPVWLLLWGVIRFAKQRVSLSSIALSTLAIFYVALFAFWPMLRDLTNGMALFVLLLGGVWAGDSAAYFAGRAFGKTRLTPLSPGKTREGIVASCVATLLMCLLLAGALRLDFWHGIAIGVLISIFAPLGDLVESLWKRELNVKDLGAILPGHGGVLDRCDSLLLTAPIVFIYALWQAL